MKYFIEAWKAKQAWLDLTKEERGDYMAQLGPAIEQLTAAGTEIITWGINDSDTSHRLEHDFFAVWKFPTTDLTKTFEDTVEGAGWYNYFEQVNMKGSPASPNDIIGHIINL